jgi:hypothetical protein
VIDGEPLNLAVIQHFRSMGSRVTVHTDILIAEQPLLVHGVSLDDQLREDLEL